MTRYEIKYLRLATKAKKASQVKTIIRALYKIVQADFACYRIANAFLNDHRHNDETKAIIQARLQRLYQKQISIYGISVDQSQFQKLEQLILNLFDNPSIPDKDYLAIYSGYLEYLVLNWKKLPGRYGKVASEPVLKYRRKELFEGEVFANQKCDVVYKHHRLKELAIYECKFGMITFLCHLSGNPQHTRNKKLRQSIVAAQRKVDYLKECERIFTGSHMTDITALDVKLITLATRSSIRTSLSLLQGLGILTKEDIETQSFHQTLAAP